jgi:hypothetical protein
VGLEQSYHLFVGLNEKEQKRIVNRAVTLLDFLRSFDLFASTFNAESSLQVFYHPKKFVFRCSDMINRANSVIECF